MRTIKQLGISVGLILAIFAVNQPAFAGGSTGGGSGCLAEIMQSAVIVGKWLGQHGSTIVPHLTGNDFLLKFNPELFRFTTQDLQYEGNPVDAYYNGKNIEVRCDRLEAESQQGRNAVVAHEIFREMGLEGDQYQVSRQILILKPSSAPNPQQYKSTVQLTAVSGASNYKLGDPVAGPIIYGGVVGNEPTSGSQCTSGVLDGVHACNTCLPGTTSPCNTARIYSSLQLSIGFKVTSDTSGFAFLIIGDDGNYYPLAGPIAVSGKGASGTFTTTWGTICQAFGQSDCEDAKSASYLYVDIQPPWEPSFTGQLDLGGVLAKSIQLYILNPQGPSITDTDSPANNTAPASSPINMSACISAPSTTAAPAFGFCGFNAEAGDKEVQINGLVENVNCPANDRWTGVRVFYVPDDGIQNFTTINYGSPHQDFKINPADCEPEGNWTVTGLTNGQGYFFLVSMLDAAGNNVYLLNGHSLIAGDSDSVPGASCQEGGGYDTAEAEYCPEYAVPAHNSITH